MSSHSTIPEAGTSLRHAIVALASTAKALASRVLNAVYSDRHGAISHPALLFTVSVFDTVLLTASGLIAETVAGAGAGDQRTQLLVLAVAIITAGVLRRNWSYTIFALHHASSQVEKIIKSLATVLIGVAGIAYIGQFDVFSPAAAIVWFVLGALALVCARLVVAAIVDRLAKAGRLVRRTVIAGGGRDAEELIASLQADNDQQLEILGVFDDRNDERSAATVGGYPKLGDFAKLSAFCRSADVDLLIVTVPITAETRLLEILKRLFTLPIDVRVSALTSKLPLNAKAYTYIDQVPMLAVMDKPLSDWDRVRKSIEDRVLGTLLLFLAAPVMAAIAIAIRLESKGPIFFRQQRYGFNNELIGVWKFRSMYASATDANASRLVTRDDPRVTRVGRFIRKTSLDELPQLFNVLKGDMSLVGPRPHAVEAKARSDLYQTVVDGYFARHKVKPGITGWAQINGWRGETDTHEKIERRIEADLYYIDNWSILLDLYILMMTPFALITGRNAY
jgi:Undecaprenyl-phosphate glucose phosphotransferase